MAVEIELSPFLLFTLTHTLTHTYTLTLPAVDSYEYCDTNLGSLRCHEEMHAPCVQLMRKPMLPVSS